MQPYRAAHLPPKRKKGLWQRLAGCWRHRPLLVHGWCAVFSILLVDRLGFSPGPGTAVGLGAAVLFGLWRRTWQAWLPCVALLYASHHGWRLAETFSHPLRLELLSRPAGPEAVSLKGRLYPWAEGAELDDATAVCEVTELRWGRHSTYRPLSAQVKVVLPAGMHLNKPGLYEISGQITLAGQPMNPGQFDPVSFGLRSGWVALVQAQSALLLREEPWSPRFHLLHWAEKCRQWMTRALSRGVEDRPEETSVLLAMALGASDAAGEDIEDSFRDSGTLHIFAVSGLHVVMLAYILSFVLQGFGMGRSRAAFWIILIVFGYAYITGWRPSAARAAFMIALHLSAFQWNRTSDVQNSLGMAVLVLLAWDSHQLFQPGFQLSFLVLWSIVVITKPALGKLIPWTELDPFLPRSLAPSSVVFFCGLRKWLAELSCTSAAAWIGSLPLTLGHFHTVTPVGLVANLVLVPLSGISIGVSCTSLLAAGAGAEMIQILANGINVRLAQAMVWSSSLFASLPFANHTFDLRFEKAPPAMEMQIFHLPGGGSSGHVRVGNEHWLVDTGNIRPWRSVLRPFFRHQGIQRVHGVFLTHGDSDHVGAAHLALRLGASRIITSIQEPWVFDPEFATFQNLSRHTEVDGAIWHRHESGDVIPISGTSSVTVLYPQRSDHHDKADDRGLVLMLQLGKTRVLWLSDAGFITEKKLLERHKDLRCDVLVRGRHPTDPGRLAELLIAAEPAVVISSNDSSRVEEAPTKARRSPYCERMKIPHLQLDRSGCVTLSIDPDGTHLRTHRSGQEFHLPVRPRE